MACMCGHSEEEHGHDHDYPGSTACTECGDCVAYDPDRDERWHPRRHGSGGWGVSDTKACSIWTSETSGALVCGTHGAKAPDGNPPKDCALYGRGRKRRNCYRCGGTGKEP